MSRPTNLDVYLYLRKSRKDLEEEKKASELGEKYDTLERHRRTLFAVAKKEQHNITHIYEEVVSGESVAERPRLQEMLREIDNGAVDAVLVMDLDRLGRGDMLDQGLLDRSFRYSATKIITPTEVYDPESETWELVFGIKSLVAREELKAITRRMQRGRVASASEGKSISKRPPYGYKRGEDLILEPDDETAWVVVKMFEMMRDGHGRQYVAQELDKLGIKPPDKNRKTWSPSSITAIIKNEVYLGTIIWGAVKYVKRNGKYKKTKVPRSKWTIKENAHKALVSPELFEAANRAHSGRWRPSTTTTKVLSNPLAGILKCEVCGYTMWFQPRKDRPNDTIHCVQPSCRSVQKGSSLNIVEQRIIDLLKEYAINVQMAFENMAPVDVSDEAPYKKQLVESKQEEISQLETQKSKLHDLLERGIYTADVFVERQQNLNERINGLQDEVRKLMGEIQKDEIRKNAVSDVLPVLQRVLDEYPSADIETRNQMLKTVLNKATYLRKKDWSKRDQFVIQLYPKI